MADRKRKKAAQRATIADVANMAGVSKTTISRYLSGQYDSIAENTRRRIDEAVKALKYRPSRMARGLKQDRSYLIGFVMADLANPFSTAILRGVEDVCRKHGYNLMVCNTDNDPVREKEYIFMLQSHRIEGLIINSTGKNNEFLRELAEYHTPVVLVDRKVPELEFDMVGTDNIQAMEQAMAFLLDQGYDSIAFFTEPIYQVSSRMERLQAFRDITARNASRASGEVYETDLRSPGQLEEHLDHFLTRVSGRFRSILAGNGVISLKIINILQQKGVRIPEDVAFIGFDDTEWAPVVASGITTVAQLTDDIGVIAMESVLRRINGDQSAARIVQLPAKLIVRNSTPPVSRRA